MSVVPLLVVIPKRMTHVGHIVLTVLGALPAVLAAACGGGADSARPVVRDSAGIVIVENSAAQWARSDAWRVGPEPLIDIGGGADSADQLFGVRGAVRLPDGGIVVANSGTSQIRFYDASGRHVVDAGRRGQGPGEFRYLSEIVRGAGDTIIALTGPGATDRFTPDGRWVRRVEAQVFGLFPAPYMSEGGHLLRDGTLLLYVYENIMDRPPGRYRPKQGFVRLDPATAEQDTLGWFLGIEHEVVGREHRWVGFSPTTDAAWTTDHIWVGDSQRFEIGVYTYQGRLVRLIRVLRPPVPVTDAMKDAFRDAWMAMVRQEPRFTEMRQYYERTVAELPWAETLPAFGPLAADAEGNLWAAADPWIGRTYPRRWTVFDGDGIMLGEVELPDRFRPFEIGRDHVLGVWTDELDVEHVRMYRLIK